MPLWCYATKFRRMTNIVPKLFPLSVLTYAQLFSAAIAEAEKLKKSWRKISKLGGIARSTQHLYPILSQMPLCTQRLCRCAWHIGGVHPMLVSSFNTRPLCAQCLWWILEQLALCANLIANVFFSSQDSILTSLIICVILCWLLPNLLLVSRVWNGFIWKNPIQSKSVSRWSWSSPVRFSGSESNPIQSNPLSTDCKSFCSLC